MDGVKDVFVLGGSSPTGGLDVRRAAVSVILDRLDNSLERKLLDIADRIPVVRDLVPDLPPHGRIRPQWEIEQEVAGLVAPIPDIRAYRLNVGPGGGSRDITYSILSNDEAALNEGVQRLEKALQGEPLLAGVSAEGALPRPELQITPRLEEAARLGVTTASIAQTLRVATIGDYDASWPSSASTTARSPSASRSPRRRATTSPASARCGCPRRAVARSRSTPWPTSASPRAPRPSSA